MVTKEIIVTVALGLVLILLWLPGIILLAKRKFYDMAFQYTCFMSEFLGFLIAVIGPIRCGKTTLSAALLHIFQMNQQRKLKQQMDNAIMVLDNLDFNQVDKLINFLSSKTKNMDRIVEAVLKAYELKLWFLYFDEFEFAKYSKILKEYVEAYFVLNIRNQYVFSKTRVYSHITGRCSLTFDDKWMQLYRVAETHECPLNKYYFFFHDEVTIDRGATNNTDQNKDPDGTKEFKALFGHLFEETCKLVSTKQSFVDEIARERRLTSTIIEIVDRREIGTFPQLRRFFQFLEDCQLFIMLVPFNLKAFFRSAEEKQKTPRDLLLYQKLKSTGRYRAIRYKYLCIDHFLKSQGYIETTTRIYSKPADVGKENEKFWKDMVFTVPMYMSYGVINTHYFAPVLDELKKLSYISDSDVPKSKLYSSPEEYKHIVSFLYDNKKETKKMTFRRL